MSRLLQLIACLLFSQVIAAQDYDYDIVIRNGRVLDGAGNPWMMADIGISDGKIKSIGHLDGHGRREIDAIGQYVSPGWIDMMDQSDGALRQVGFAPNKINMGVTTLIAGEGGTPVPAAQISEYFNELTEKGISVNFACYYSATQARVAVLGETDIDPTPAQLEAMKKLIAEAMEAGAMGITTALIYPPSAYHKTDNLVELAKVVARYNGTYASHIRDESGKFITAVREAIRIGEESGSRVEIFHLKAAFAPNWGKDMPIALDLIQSARDRGVDISADLYPYIAAGTGIEVSIPTWAFAEGMDELLVKLRDPEIREQFKKELAAGPQDNWTNLIYSGGGWQNVVLANSHLEQYSQYHGQDFTAIGKALEKDPADVAWDIILEAYPERAVALFFMMNEDDLRLAMTRPFTSIGSDAASALKEGDLDALGLPHPRSYGTFPRIVAHYVRDEGVLSLPEAIRKMTSLPASRMGFTDRGVLREGLAADIVIFDLATIKDTATWDEPTAKPLGINYVLVNGQLVLDSGQHTGATPGQVLRGPGYRKQKGT